MTLDGIPIVDQIQEVQGFYVAVGMCGQGLMLGPGIAVNLANMILNGKPIIDEKIFKYFSFYRDYTGHSEALR